MNNLKNNLVKPEKKKTNPQSLRYVGLRGYFFKSRWEANYSRYLQYLLELGEIDQWTYQGYAFYFDEMVKGSLSFMPTFQVLRKDGIWEYHEVKIFSNPRTRAILNKMRSQFPNVNLVLIDKSWFRDHEERFKKLIAGWEN